MNNDPRLERGSSIKNHYSKNDEKAVHGKQFIDIEDDLQLVIA